MVLTAERKKLLDNLEAILRKELLKSWRDQGHYIDGSIVDTADFVIKETVNKLSFLVYMFPYGGYIESGVSAANVPFSGTHRGSGGGRKSKYIQALIRYAKKRMSLPDAKAKSVAFAIAHKQKKEGMPTRGSYKYSKTGERTGWIDATFKGNKTLIEKAMFELADKMITVEFDNMITKYQKQFKATT